MQRWSKEPRNCLHDVYCLTSISKFPTKAYQETHKNKKKNSKRTKNRSIAILPLVVPRSRSPMKKGRNRMKLNNEAENPVGGSIHSDLCKRTLQTHHTFSSPLTTLK